MKHGDPASSLCMLMSSCRITYTSSRTLYYAHPGRWQFINGIISRRIISYLKEHDFKTSLAKLRHQVKRRRYTYSLWDHHPDTRLLLSEEMLMQRVHYTHQNPVRAGLVMRAEEYRWSSVRCWTRNVLDDEPLLMDIARIRWRSRGGAS